MTRKGIILAGGSGIRPRWTAVELGITLRFEGQGVDEKAYVAAISDTEAGTKAPALKVGDCVVAEDLKAAQQTALLRQHGFHTPVSRE